MTAQRVLPFALRRNTDGAQLITYICDFDALRAVPSSFFYCRCLCRYLVTPLPTAFLPTTVPYLVLIVLLLSIWPHHISGSLNSTFWRVLSCHNAAAALFRFPADDARDLR